MWDVSGNGVSQKRDSMNSSSDSYLLRTFDSQVVHETTLETTDAAGDKDKEPFFWVYIVPVKRYLEVYSLYFPVHIVPYYWYVSQLSFKLKLCLRVIFSDHAVFDPLACGWRLFPLQYCCEHRPGLIKEHFQIQQTAAFMPMNETQQHVHTGCKAFSCFHWLCRQQSWIAIAYLLLVYLVASVCYGFSFPRVRSVLWLWSENGCKTNQIYNQ